MSEIAATSTDGPKLYTLDDLNAHNSRDSLYMLLNDKVYDVTRFLDEHPGGDEVMLEEAGRDATEAFDDVGHSDEAREMLPKMLLGNFNGEKKSKKATSTTATASKSSSSGISFVVPIAAIIAAYLAWRFLLA